MMAITSRSRSIGIFAAAMIAGISSAGKLNTLWLDANTIAGAKRRHRSTSTSAQ